MELYRLGAFWNNDEIIKQLEKRVNLTNAQATDFELYVRTYCHNLLVNGILNYDMYEVDERVIVQPLICRIITHNKLGIQLFMKAILDIPAYAEAGDEHQEVKFNPIDNGNINANLTKEDVVQHHTLRSLGDALQLFPEADRILADIYSELSHMCMPCLNANLISQIIKLNLDNHVSMIDIISPSWDPKDIAKAFYDANPDLQNYGSLIIDEFTVYVDPAYNVHLDMYGSQLWTIFEDLNVTVWTKGEQRHE